MTVGIRATSVLLALATLAALVALIAAEPVPATPRADRAQVDLKVEKAGGASNPGRLSALQRRAMDQGPLVPDAAAYERDKAEANAKAARTAGEEPARTAPTSQAPTSVRAPWNGIFDTATGPSDSTGAIGPTRYVELVNSRYAIYSRTSNTPLAQGTLQSLAGEFDTATVFDPQVIWDAATNRFYYVADHVVSDTDNRIAFGFSKTASPSSAADWCQYSIPYGEFFPDYPKLGDTSNLVLFGTNTFNGVTGEYEGSDLYSVTKPPAGSTCPAPSSLVVGEKLNLTDSSGNLASTPVPTNQIDTNATGWAVAVAGSNPSTRLPTYKITRNTNGTLNVAPVRSVAVPSYAIPANAPQPGTTRKLDTLDGRITQAVSAVDPARGASAVAIWTQHTVFGGAGAQVRWYEINPTPVTPTLFQTGAVSGASTGASNRFVYNAAISPDRQVSGTVRRFGNSMVLGFNTSSATQRPDIRMGSKIGTGATTFQATPVRASSFSLNDFTCSSGTCRWGDYAAATPDPAVASTATRGQVWLTNMYVRSTGSASSSGWGTTNWAARP